MAPIGEPDLSMELQERLKRDLAARAATAEAAAERLKVKMRQGAATEIDEAGLLEKAQEVHAHDAAQGIASMLKEFHGDLPAAKVSEHVRCIVHSDVIVGDMPKAFRGALRKVVPEKGPTYGAVALEKLGAAKAKTVELVQAPKFQTMTISAAGGAVVLGAVGGAFGTACGVVVGTTAGVVPALFTFGLSMPVGATIGGGMGLCIGSAAGAGTGAFGGAAGGHVVYAYRVEIKDGLIYLRTNARDSVDGASTRLKDSACCARAAIVDAKESAQTRCMDTLAAAKTKTTEATARAKNSVVAAKTSTTEAAARLKDAMATKATRLGEGTKQILTDPVVQKASASAAGGAILLGTTGGACGGVAGGTLGAAVGIVPAIFTFGLSIPVCAVVGGGAGLCAGAALGAGAGAAGGAAGYGGFHYRAEIGLRAGSAAGYLRDSVAIAGAKARDSACQMTGSLHTLVRGSSTGGTD